MVTVPWKSPQLFPVVLPCPTWKMVYQWCCPELLPPTTSAPGSRGIPGRSSDVVSQVESPSTMVSGKKSSWKNLICLKNHGVSSSVGMMTFQLFHSQHMESIGKSSLKHVPVTTNRSPTSDRLDPPGMVTRLELPHPDRGAGERQFAQSDERRKSPTT